MTRVVKHLLYWGMGKLIYPIRSSGVYCLTKETKHILTIDDEAVAEQLMQKLPSFFDRNHGNSSEREESSDRGAVALKKALKIFEKPVSLL